MMVRGGVLGALFAILAVVGGCETVHNAREAQKEVALAPAEEQGALKPLVGEKPSREMRRVNLVGYKLADFVAFAVTNRPDIIEAAYDVMSARLNLKDVESESFLMMDFAGGYSQATHNNTPSFSWHQRGQGTASFSFDLLLYDFGRLDAREQAARLEIAAAEKTYSEMRLTVFADVATTYFTLCKNDALLAVALTNELQYAEHLRQAEILLDAGETKKLDVLKARLDLSDAHLTTITASNDVKTATAEFIRALGLKTDETSREELLPPHPEVLTHMKRLLVSSDYTAESALRTARDSSPTLSCLRARLQATSSNVDYAIADLMPSISVGSAFNFADPTWNWSWGFTAVQSIFKGLRKTTAVDQAVVTMRVAREALMLAEQELACKLSTAVAVRDTARQTFDTACVQVIQAKENYENVVEEYRVGEASRIDFTDAASSYASAQGSRVKAFYAEQIAEAALVKLVGLTALYTE